MVRSARQPAPAAGNEMAGAIQAMTAMAAAMNQQAAAVAQQAEAQTQRDILRQQREEAAAASKGLADFRRHNPPKFKGEHDPDKADLWMQEIEKIFDILHCLENVKVEYATYLLSGEAEYWWRGTKQMMEASHEELTWETFKKKFLDKYFPKSARAEKEAQFLRLYQGNLTIAEYAARFESLAKHFRYFQNQMDEEYMCERFEYGLRYEIKESVEPLEIREYQKLVEKCKKVEIMKRGKLNRTATSGPVRSQGQNDNRQDRGSQFFQPKPYDRPQGNARDQPQSPFGGAQRTQNQVSNRPPGPNQTQTIRCYACGKEGHKANECADKAKVCYNCQKPGHLSRDCRAPRVQPAANNISAARPTARGRVYQMGGEEVMPSSEPIQGTSEFEKPQA